MVKKTDAHAIREERASGAQAADKFVQALAAKIDLGSADEEAHVTKGTFRHHLEGVLAALPKGPLRSELVHNKDQYTDQLWNLYALLRIVTVLVAIAFVD